MSTQTSLLPPDGQPAPHGPARRRSRQEIGRAGVAQARAALEAARARRAAEAAARDEARRAGHDGPLAA